jgi:hypothetical protein
MKKHKEDTGNTVTIMRTIGGLSQLATLQILTKGERDKLNEFLGLELPLFESFRAYEYYRTELVK